MKDSKSNSADFIPKGVLKLAKSKDQFLDEYDELDMLSSYEREYDEFFLKARDKSLIEGVSTTFFPSFWLQVQLVRNAKQIT